MDLQEIPRRISFWLHLLGSEVHAQNQIMLFVLRPSLNFLTSKEVRNVFEDTKAVLSNKAEVFQVGCVHKTPCMVRCSILLGEGEAWLMLGCSVFRTKSISI